MPSAKNFFLLLILASLLLSLFVSTSTKTTSPSEPLACNPTDLSGEFQEGEILAFFEGKRIEAPGKLQTEEYVLGTYSGEERWIEVDLSDQKLLAWEGNNLFLETSISSGLPWWPTPRGEFRIWIKLRATKMEGGQGRNYYYLPNVPYVMFFENENTPGRRGYGLHGTYWHNDFGRPRSHGCVNLPTSVAEKLYHWVDKGTRIVIHD